MNLQPHTGNTCPVDPDALVAADLGDGELIVDRADALAWGTGEGDDGEGRIQRYALLNVEHIDAPMQTYSDVFNALFQRLGRDPITDEQARLSARIAMMLIRAVELRKEALLLMSDLKSYQWSSEDDGNTDGDDEE